MPQVIPLQPTPSQTVSVTLNNQACQIEVRQNSTGVYVNLWINNALIIGGVIAENLNLIVRSAYLGFVGDLAFYDTTGANTDPVFTGLGSQYVLEYFAPSELPAGLQ
jgi:uncharacterized protein DUF6983